MKKSLKSFIRENKSEIDEAINRVVSFVPKTAGCFGHRMGTDHYHEQKRFKDSERLQWILNDEGLYRWARSEGVNI
jgi:hypothetical protein